MHVYLTLISYDETEIFLSFRLSLIPSDCDVGISNGYFLLFCSVWSAMMHYESREMRAHAHTHTRRWPDKQTQTTFNKIY
jgi:hypothetical protein